MSDRFTESPFKEIASQNSDMSEQIDKIAGALSKAQGEMSFAKKDATNLFFKSKYADLASVWSACRDVLSKNGLAVVQTTLPTDGKTISVRTLLIHSSGQWFRGTLTMLPTKIDPQAIGSCLTYARRYALASIVGVSPEDDDAETATDKNANVRTLQELENYRITFGKWKSHQLKDIDPHEIGSYIDYIFKKAEKDDKSITGQVREFIDTAEEYISLIKPGAMPNGGSIIDDIQAIKENA